MRKCFRKDAFDQALVEFPKGMKWTGSQADHAEGE